MNNQNDHNGFGDQYDRLKNNSLPEKVNFSEDGNDFGSNRESDLPNGGKSGKPRINRTLYVTAVVLLLSVAVIAAVTSAANRSKKKTPPVPTETTQSSPYSTPFASSADTPSESEPDTAPESAPSVETEDNTQDVVNKLPTFELPVAGTLAVKHDPELQVFSPTMQEYRVHLGIDINTTEGAPVYASAKGTVTRIWNDVKLGWCIEISHDGGACTYYKNRSETMASGITEGASVKSGQLLGSVGESAMMEVAQEPHLHFEMTVNGELTDPLEYFSTDVLAELDGDTNYEG